MSDGKKSLIYTERILERTDERNPVTAGMICDILENEYDIMTERRTVGRNIKTLIDTGMKIRYCKDNRKGCYLAERIFDEVELKFLLDSVDKGGMLREDEAENLKSKILSLASEGMKKVLSDATGSGILGTKMIKADESSVFETIRIIILCMREGRKLSFMYGDRDWKLKLRPRRNGALYTVDPYVLTQGDGRYYLVCRYSDMSDLSYYRLDRMIKPHMAEEKITAPKEFLGEGWREHIAGFIDGAVRNYGGDKKVIILLRAPSSMIGYMYDEFGENILRTEEAQNGVQGYLDIYINTTENDGLYYLLLQYGSNIEIIAPDTVRAKYIKMLKSMMEKYRDI